VYWVLGTGRRIYGAWGHTAYVKFFGLFPGNKNRMKEKSDSCEPLFVFSLFLVPCTQYQELYFPTRLSFSISAYAL
jgi:hypothetical protein